MIPFKNIPFAVLFFLIAGSTAFAGSDETICGYVDKLQYCRPAIHVCPPPEYELNAPLGNFLGRYALTSLSPQLKMKFQEFSDSKAKVCARGVVSVTPQSFPEVFEVTDIFPDTGQIQGKTRTMVSFRVTSDIQGEIEASLTIGSGKTVYIRLFNAATGEPLECGVDLDIDHVVVTDSDGNKLAEVKPFCHSNLGGVLAVYISVTPPSNTTAGSPDHMLPIYLSSPDSTFESMPRGITVN